MLSQSLHAQLYTLCITTYRTLDYYYDFSFPGNLSSLASSGFGPNSGVDVGEKAPRHCPLSGPWDPPPPAPAQPLRVLFIWRSPCLCALLLGTDPEETILHAFKVFDTEGKGFIKADL